MRAFRFAMLLAVGVAAPPSASPHHSFATEFDATRPFTVTGIVSRVDWRNPHVFFYLDVVDDKSGALRTWAMELASPNVLIRAGWSRDTLKINDRVTVSGSLARDGSAFGNAVTVVLTQTSQRIFSLDKPR